MALYRTYRPKTFEDVVGQDPIVTTLRQAVATDHIAHAYLFAGIRGTGKTSVARILARILLTRGIGDAALQSQIHQAIDEDNLVDLTEIDAASNTGVDNIRDLIEKIQFTPVVAAAKVTIIDEVHMLSKGAFNALLKTLEEPPPYAYFILATTEMHKIPATIQSRCQRFLFRQIKEEDIVKRLRFVAEKESIDVEEEALHAIARHVQGGMRDAISLLDQLRSLPRITRQDVTERIGETGHEEAQAALEAIRGGDRAAVLALTRRIEEAGIPLENFIRLLLSAVRDDLHAAVASGHSTERQRRMLQILLQAAKDVRVAPLPGLVLESALLSLCDEPVDGPRPTTIPPTPPPPPSRPTPPSRASHESRVMSQEKTEPHLSITQDSRLKTQNFSISLDSLRPRWQEIIAKVGPPSALMSLKNGMLHAVEGKTIVVRFSSEFHHSKAGSLEGIRSAEASLSEAIGAPLRLRYVLDSDLLGPPPLPDAEQVDTVAAVRDVF